MLKINSNLQFDFSTTYLGLQLKNPFIVSSSGLTSTLDRVLKCEAAGAGAVVLKSIFEEQMAAEASTLQSYDDYPEAAEYLAGYMQQEGLRNYLTLIKECSEACQIPIIASINCSSSGSWVNFAREIELAGAAAIELNIFVMSSDPNTTSTELEARYIAIAEEIKDVVTIPITIKIPNNFSAPLNLIQALYFRGIKGVTMFNRFYSPDVDLRKVTLHTAGVLSSAEELNPVLRWIALSSAQLPLIDIAASTGIHSGRAAAKAILCGATVVELCSILYKEGVEHLEAIISEFKEWAQSENYVSITEFRAKLNASSVANSEIHERAQFMRYFSQHKA